MKKRLLLIFVLVGCCALSGVAQMKVDAQGRIIFGKQPYNTAISIVDETTSPASWNNPFRITYKSNEMITLSRTSSFGMMFTPTGSIVVGYNMPANSSSYVPLEIYGCDYAGGIKVSHPSSSSFAGISVNLSNSSSPYAYSYEALNGSSRKFYVNGNGLVYSQTQISELRSEIEKPKYGSSSDELFRSSNNMTRMTGIANPLVAECKLHQNAPNPFNLNTQIRFYIPANVKTAQLYIYDLQGKQVKHILITQRGDGSQLISGSELTAGMYLYSLIVDGNEVDTKRMILTK